MPLDSTNYVETKPDTQIVTDLLAMRTLLSDPTRWCQNALAKTRRGAGADPLEESAASWCLVGAAAKIGGGYTNCPRFSAIHSALSKTAAEQGECLSSFNNSVSHDHIGPLIDRTIARLRAQP